MVATATKEKRLCLDCPRDISDRARNVQRCKVCAKERDKERANNYYLANREKVLERVARYQQTPEAKQKRREWEGNNQEKIQGYRQDQKQKHREKTGYNPEGRTCANEDCNADISNRGHNAKWCEKCSKPPPRKCEVCPNDVVKRGPSKFCSDQCKAEYWQLKESNGYTKTCTKCKKTKMNTEFGWHSGRRRSVCRSCGVKDQTERYQNFTPEQRARRNLLKRENERSKKANRTPEEKAIQRAKRRKAYRRSRFGTDFDEDQLYSEQGKKCAICGTPKLLEEMELDHDHATNKPRGLLCKNCNFKLLSQYEEKFPLQHKDSPRLNAYLDRGKV